ncbi:hypothetical protein [Agrobacterium sp. FDAARGOS_525]|uniref:hypothetical protein n=1 Tax=Agrobacterium sp. FDAARGOS_525 TaxID=2420311 RepID=UPI000F66C358|nr:hypothetical protein [Agrobacterium sp. FDAARGOS_525]
MTIAMHFEHLHDPTSPPLSPSNLVRAIGNTGIASRNTVHTFLMEMRKYHFVAPIERVDRRQRAVRATEMSEHLIRRYFDIHLRALDLMDEGTRFALSCEHPELLHYAQPRFIWMLVNCSDWYKPPHSIAKFVSSDSGSSVLHDLIKAVPPLATDEARPIWIGKVSPKVLSSRYRISRTHTARLFSLARESQLIGWAKESNRGDCWISPQLVRDYLYWQAIKLASVSKAFEDACMADGFVGISSIERPKTLGSV